MSHNTIFGLSKTADLIRGKDWSRTPLGPIDTWGSALVTSVNMALAVPTPIQLLWGKQMIVLYNDAFVPILTHKHPKALGVSAREVWGEVWPDVGAQLEAVFSMGSSFDYRDLRLEILSHGKLEEGFYSFTYSPIRDANGQIVGLLNISQNTTPTVLAERELRRSREEFEIGMDAASLGMWQYDSKTGVVVADERMQRIFGFPEPNGAVDYWLDLLHPDDRDRVGEHFTGVVAGRHEYDIEYRIVRHGEMRWLRSKGKVSGDKRDPERMFAIIEDITERKQAEAALQQNEKLAAVGRLASTIAHEINNPLESVTNLLFLIQNSHSLDDIHSYVATAEQELRRVSLIANQTLRFHRQAAKAAPANCYDLIGDTLAMYQGRIVNNKINVEKRKRAKNPVECFGDEIRQVLSNLMVNAIDAMPFGGRLILRSRETTNQRTGRRGLVLTIADTGLGMSATVQQKVFEAFYTTKGMGGTGLGLWISKDLVERHGGTLRVRSCDKPGKSGTVFLLFLPHAVE